ncbi:keratin, type I cytoskeletal 18 [Meriones unguiculatus]|uniref:keratin, type I cytoskeletal 18 n=1 Tax=Meriones unguiculatus TaxID=10047 RepID=UPI000B4F6E79|nr:keratin, type I cytoskeletal 18 [Meriones unguiculatus]XP_021499230.1 keratin, type I cytoskeletal 18 [Meriones unguiculatus]
MSFTTRSTTFSTNYRSLGSVRTPSQRVRPASSAASVYAGAGGSGSRISVSRSTSVWGGSAGSVGSVGSAGPVGMGSIQTEKETMQDLNDRLASYLDKVKSLETENRRLESKIREHLEKKGPQGVRDWGHYFKTIEDLKAQIFDTSVDNARIVLQIDNARLAADDFRVKYETELAMRQSVENDIHGLRKVVDDTNITRLQLETEIEALKEELLFMKKNHEEEVRGLEAQIASSGLTVEVDAPKSQDLNKIMADIRAQYEELAQKNREELDKYWSQQIESSTTIVTTKSAESKNAENTLTELRRTLQTLEMDLESMNNQKVGLENHLADVEARYSAQMEQLNGLLLHLESELAQTRAEGQRQTQEYEALLNVKVKLEAEIATYRRLLEDGEDFSLSDALDSSNSMQTVQRTTTRKVVDGKVVSETNDTRVLRH